MRPKKLRSIGVFLLILIHLFIVSPLVLAQESSFSLIPEKSQIRVGEKVNIPIQAKDTQNVYAYELTINYDSSILKLEEATSDLDGYGFTQEVKDGEIRYVFTLMGKDTPELNGDLTLCNIIVSSKNTGDADIVLKKLEATDNQLNIQEFSPEAKATIKVIKKSSGGSGGGSKTDEDTEQPIESEPTEPEDEPQIPEKTFDDIGNYPWAKEAIEFLASKGIIQGTSATTYSPDAQVERADFMLLLVRALGLTSDFDDNFSDVAPNSYYYEALGIAKALGIAQGIGDNMFDPESAISRQDLMVLIDRAIRIVGINLVDGSESDLDVFADKSEIAPYAIQSVATLVKNGIIIGDGNYINPRGNATRAETAVIIFRIYNK